MHRKIHFAIIVLLLCTTNGFAQKIVFAQDYHYKNNAFSKKLMSSYIFEDSVSKEKLILLSGSKTINFYVVNDNFKLQKAFEVDMNKKSAFWNDNFKIDGFSHQGDKWVIIAGDYGDYAAEIVDTRAGTLSIAGKVYEDKDPKFLGEGFSDGVNNYNMYPNRSGSISIANIDGNAGVKTINIDLITQIPLKKNRKYTAKELFESSEMIDSLTNQIIYFTRSKVQFYPKASTFLFGVAEYDPAVELISFDKISGKKISSELYSVEELLPASAKGEKLNTAFLVYDEKVWVYSGSKNAGVLAAFDIKSKKVLYSKVFDEKMDIATFGYGPVEYKAVPSTGKIFSGESYIKEKVEDISANKYLSELWKGDLGIYVHPVNENEYVVSVGSYNMTSYMASNSANRDNVPQLYDYRIYESSVAGIVFNKASFSATGKKTTYNDVNYSKADSKYSIVKADKDEEDPEFKNRKAYLIRQQPIKNRMYSMYYFEDQFKIAEKILPFDLSATGIR